LQKNAKCDIAIIIPKNHELNAFQLAFNVKFKEHAGNLIKPEVEYFQFPYKCGKSTISIIVFFMNSQNNTYSKDVTRAVLTQFKPTMIFLLGTAAGRKADTKEGDVVISTIVFDTLEGNRRKGGKWEFKPRIRGTETSNILSNVSRYVKKPQTITSYQKQFNSILNKLSKNKILSKSYCRLKPSCHLGCVSSGNDILEDPKLMKTIWNMYYKIFAYDMESAGFCEICEMTNTPYLIIRGISDHATIRSSDKQIIATVSASLFLKRFIERGLFLQHSDENKLDTTNIATIISKNDLRNAYANLRKNVNKVDATWCGRYKKVRSYFNDERNFLKKYINSDNQKPIIRRLINPLTISYDELIAHREHTEIIQQKKELDVLYECKLSKKLRDLEFMIITDNSDNDMRATFSLVSNFQTGFGIELNPKHHKEVEDEVRTLNRWFRDMYEDVESIPWENGTNLWNLLSNSYDSEFNANSLLTTYLSEEANIVSNECANLHNKPITIVDIGCSTGNLLFKIHEILKNDTIRYVGIDASKGMIEKAIEKTKTNIVNNFDFKTMNVLKSENILSIGNNSFKIVCCMLNTIGLFRPDQRTKLLSKMRMIAGDDGIVILSIFDGNAFSMANEIYDKMPSLLKDIDKHLSYDAEDKAFRTYSGFMTQWLSDSKQRELLPHYKSLQPVVVKDNSGRSFAKIFILKPSDWKN